MFLSLGFPIGTILFLSINLIMYMFKKKYHDFQNKLFQILLSFTFLSLFLEISYVITMRYMDTIPFINEVVCRMFLTGIILWVVTFFFYIFAIGFGNTNSKYKERIYQITPYIITLLCSALAIIDSFFEIDYIIDNGQYAIVGPATFFVYGVVIILLLILFIYVLKNRKHFSKTLRLPLYYSLFLILMDSLHLYFFEINDLTLMLALIVSSLYFTVESQDRLLLKEVGDAKSKSEEVNKAKTEFLSKMSHEIRTPMNTILGFSNALLMDEHLTKEKVLEDSKSINQASNNLLELINNILELSRLESGKETLNEKEYKISDVLVEINNTLENKVGLNNNYYDLEIDETIPSVYYGDYSKVVKIVCSLVLNSIKYTENGYINVSVNHSQNEDNNYLNFIISNTGNKMPKDYYNKDFSDFSKLDYGSDNKLDSEFLGLIIAKRLIEMFEDSKIIFKSDENVTKCLISICQKVVDKSNIGKEALKEKNEGVVDCSNKKALIVDDNEINLKLAERLLKNYNFNITKTTSGNECIDLVKTNDYDVIFLDHMMPDLDGLKTMEVLKSLNKDIPVTIAMTANSNIDSEDFYKEKGFDDYLSKPINKKRLDELIDKIFGGNK